jgi:translation initiation factor IF-1
MKSELFAVGRIDQILGDGFFRVTLEANGHQMLCKPSGKMLKVNRIRLTQGDTVRVSICEYDLARGIITYRL